MSTIVHVEAGRYLRNKREFLCDPQRFIAKKAKRAKEWVGRVERGEFTEKDIELIIRAYDLDEAKQKELRQLLRKELQQAVAMADAV
jgi:hypothetical protein